MREGWTYKKLGEVCETSSGGTPSKSHLEYYESGTIPWLRSGEVAQGLIYDAELRITDLGLEKSSAKIFPVDTVVLAMYGATVGQVGLLKKEMATNQAICGILPNRSFNPMFLLYTLKSKKSVFLRDAVGGAQPNISQNLIKNTTIPIPPLSEQHRIVSELDLLSSIIEKKKAQLKEYDQLAQSIFYDMFGDPVTNEKGWEVKKLGEVCSKISDGVHAKPKYTESGMPFISVVNINKRYLDFDNCKFVSYEDGEIINKRAKPQRNDVLYTKVGATYGIPALVDTDKDFCLYVSVCLIKPLHEIIDSVFLSNMMALPYVKNQADERIKGIGVPDLHLNQISAFNIILPPLSLQQSFASKIEAIEHQKALVQQSITETETLFNSCMDYYFD